MTNVDHDPHATALDGFIERLGRDVAGRTTRRGFFGRMGKLGVMVAGGSAVAGLLAETADARVCGQSGVSPLCPDYDCVDSLGWCWYAVGCCAGGKLKKICDCCAPVNNVHGYCPAGTNVKCVLEACGTDPRVMKTPVRRLSADTPSTVARMVREARFPNGASTVVLTDSSDLRVVAVATPVASIVGGPLLRQGRGALTSGTRSLLTSLGARRVKVVGPELPASLDLELEALGLEVERVGAAIELDVFSGEVAQWVIRKYGSSHVVAVGESTPAATEAVAVAAAGWQRLPLVIGAHAVRAAERPAWCVGSAATSLRTLWTGSRSLVAGTLRELASVVATELAAPGELQQFSMAPTTSTSLLELGALGLPIVLHEPASLTGTGAVIGARDDHQPGLVYLCGVRDTITQPNYRLLQSRLNGYGVDDLIGVPGQGLPVISQPYAERPVGLAREGDDPPPPAAPGPGWAGWVT